MTRDHELKALAQRLIDWNRKYPNSSVNAPLETVVSSELELDDIISDFDTVLKASAA